jgi:hypothetical protein
MQVAKPTNQKVRTSASEKFFALTILILANAIIPSSVLAQTKATGTEVIAATNGSSRLSNENRSDPTTKEEIIELKKQLTEQQKQIDELRFLVQEQKRLMAHQPDGTASTLAESSPARVTANTAPQPSTTVTPATAKLDRQSADGQEAQPLSFRIGSANITPVGFMDFTAVFRSTNPGTGIGTNFGSIPFNNTTAGKLTELRLSAQNSRIGFRVDANVKGANVIGYFESDFLGSVPGNVSVSSNSVPNRLRLYWVDVRKGKMEFMGGQSWSMLTPNRKGLSPVPGDIFYTQDIDVNYQAGLVWSRDPQFRVVYHPNSSVAFGVSLENPEQYIGGSAGGGLVTLPSALVTPYANELSNGNTNLAVPNVHPDIITKIAFDRQVGDRSMHIEAAGVVRTFRLYNPLSQQYFTATGGGGSVNLNFEIIKNLRVVSNNYYSDGGGRWIFGQAPDLIVRGDGSPSLIHSGSTVTGFESQATKDTVLYGYYGGVYVQRNTAIDPTNGKLVGYGYPGSPSSQNRVIHQATFGFTRTFWKDPKYGALQLMGQYSFLLRRPWSVAAGQPSEAHSNIVFLNLRYLLPGSAPKIK